MVSQDAGVDLHDEPVFAGHSGHHEEQVGGEGPRLSLGPPMTGPDCAFA